jgi:hypothetical protein
MTFSNIATKRILNGVQDHGSYPGTLPLGNGFVYLKYAWSIKITDSDLNSAPPLVAKTCELPRFSVETQIVNVYNHKTIVQTKLNYEPITMSFYDQASGAAESMIWNFVKDQFDPTDASKASKFKPLTIEITMKNLSEPGAAPKVYTLKNAFIVDAQHDTLDYGTSEPVLWTITVRYEDLEAPDFKGPTPMFPPTLIKPLPKPPKPPVSNNKKRSDSSFTPITKPPKADARAETKPNFGNAWTNAGGTVTGGGAATGNPTMTNQTRLGNPNIRPGSLRDRAAQANAAREAARAWPGSTANGTASTNSVAAGTVNPSTGSNIPATSNKQREMTPKQKDFVSQQEADVKNAGYTEAYKKAYIENLKKNPPVSDSPQSMLAAQRNAEALASRDTPRYPSQARTTDAGIASANASLRSQEPAPNPVREGTSVIRTKPNDTKGNELVSRQVQLEQLGLTNQAQYDNATNSGRVKRRRNEDY